MIMKDGSKLKSDLYTKETNTHQFLYARSYTKYAYKKSIPYGQAIRLKTIFSDEDDLASRLEELRGWLTNHGHKNDVVTKETGKLNLILRKDVREKRLKKTDKTLVLIFHPALNNVFEILRKVRKYV